MLKKKPSTKMQGTLAFAVLIGVIAAWMIMFAGCAIVTYMVNGESAALNTIGKLSASIHFTAAVAGCLAAATYAKRMRVQVCAITAGAYCLTLLAVTALFFGGQYSGIGTTVLMVCLGAGVAIALGIPIKKGTKIKAIKRAYR